MNETFQLPPTATRRIAPSGRLRRRGASMVECVFAVLLTGLLVSGAMEALRASTMQKMEMENRLRARLLALELIGEAAAESYADPSGTAVFGKEADETGPARSSFDDVDDYTAYAENPICDRSGAAYTNSTGWTRSVTVRWVQANDFETTAGSETGYKRIDVEVLYDGRILTSLSVIRTKEAM